MEREILWKELLIRRPTLLLDERKCRANILRMASRARRAGVHYRPHFKTHQATIIGEWFRDAGVQAITVSSVEMGHYFARAGWRDITIAFPVNIHELDRINLLASSVTLNLLISSETVANIVSERLLYPVGVFIEVDTGYHRSGLQPTETGEIQQVMRVCHENPLMTFKGLLSHFGETYQAVSPLDIGLLYQKGIDALHAVRRSIPAEECLFASIGDTPSCSVIDQFPGIDEIRPGNSVFNDLMQRAVGACIASDIALCLAVPVIEVHLKRGELIVYGGAIHLSKERLRVEEGEIYGAVVTLEDNGWSAPVPRVFVKSLSQEHGIISGPEEWIHRFQPGDILGVLPVHACLTAQAMGSYVTLEGRQISMFRDIFL